MSAASSQRFDPLRPPHDRRAALASVRWQRQVPEELCSLGELADADYADMVTALFDVGEMEPEQLVRTTLHGVPRGLLLLMPFVQRVFLGLRLKLRPSPDRVLGWRIADRGERWIRIESASWFMTAHVVMHAGEGRVSFASFIRYDRWLAAWVWPPVCRIHRRVGIALVRSAIRTLSATDDRV